MPEPTRMEQLVSLCKRRGFIYPASEIYGGINGFWDYGPLGVLLKNNLRDDWWRNMVECPPVGPDGHPLEIVGLDTAIIQNPKTWEASGHVAGFTDPMVDCRTEGCKGRFRADQLEELQCPLKPSKSPGQFEKCSLTEPRQFNLMFESHTGAVKDESSKVYLRPETAQGIFLNFKNIIDTMRVKVPFGVAQVGKAFRNEVTPRNYIFRSREFEQMEMEWFCHPDDADKWYEYWKAERIRWWRSLGVSEGDLKFRDHEPDELSHYSKKTVDIEYRYPFTTPDFAELEGIAHRFPDLAQHQKYSGQKLEYFDQERNERYLPNVIEPAAGLTRGLLVLLCEAFTPDETRASKVYMKFPPRLAPIKVGVIPSLFTSGIADGPEVDALCHPYEMWSTYSCQNGPVVALNADRWREATPQWPADLASYRTMLVNHEVGHLLHLHHPDPQCPGPGLPAPIMAQQSTELGACLAHPWPLQWEIDLAAQRREPLAPTADHDPADHRPVPPPATS